MAKHRRYPVKNSRKYKMMNSQSKTVLSIGNVFDDLPPPKPAENIKNQRKNKPPPDSLLDDQPMTWRQRELRELASKSKETTTKKRNRKTTAKNSLSAQAEKLGYHQRPLEDPDKLINRISMDANKAINDEMIKARFGTAGRDVKEIGKEYETLDKKLKRRRKKY